MSIELTIDRTKSDAQEAITQFAARRGYQLSHPWYLDGLRIEDVRRRGENIGVKPERGRGFWRSLHAMLNVPAPGPRADIELKRRKGRTIVSMSLGGHPDSVHLAYELRAYLSDGRAFTCECPPLCPACSSTVRNYSANYCAWCGQLLISRRALPASALDDQEYESKLESALMTEASPASASAARKRSSRSRSKDGIGNQEAVSAEGGEATRPAALEPEPDDVQFKPEASRESPSAEEPATGAKQAAKDAAMPAADEGGPSMRLPPVPERPVEGECEADDEPEAAPDGPEDDSGAGWRKQTNASFEERPNGSPTRRLLAED